MNKSMEELKAELTTLLDEANETVVKLTAAIACLEEPEEVAEVKQPKPKATKKQRKQLTRDQKEDQMLDVMGNGIPITVSALSEMTGINKGTLNTILKEMSSEAPPRVIKAAAVQTSRNGIASAVWQIAPSIADEPADPNKTGDETIVTS